MNATSTISFVAHKGSSFLRQLDIQSTSGEHASIKHNGRRIQLEWNEQHNLWQERGIAASRLQKLVRADVI